MVGQAVAPPGYVRNRAIPDIARSSGANPGEAGRSARIG
jgi:hypothetical protein